MANKNYTYPRVSILSEAKKHSSVQPAVEDTTVLFAPIMTEKGPDREIVRIHSLSEFIETFGNLSYERNGQMALNIYNWLMNGGTVYVYRLAGYNDAEKAVIKSENAPTYTEKFVACNKDYFKNGLGNTEDILELFDNMRPNEMYYIMNQEKEVLYVVNGEGTSIQTALTQFVKEPDDSNPNKNKTNYYFYSDVYYNENYYNENKPTEAYASYKKDDDYIQVGIDGLFLHHGVTEKESLIRYKEKSSSESSDDTTEIGRAKYFGKYYNSLKLKIKVISTYDDVKTFNINVIKVSEGLTTVVETFPRLTVNNYKSAIISSEYIDPKFDINNEISTWINSNDRKENDELVYKFGEADDKGVNNDIEALRAFYASTEFNEKLSNVIETPIDIMFDAGYPKDIKKAMLKKISATSPDAVRPDIICIFDNYQLTSDSNGKFGYLSIPEKSGIDTETDQYFKANNIAFYDQYFTINDSIFTGQNIYVTPTYFLSKLIAYNDMNYGIQFPTAGIRRGVLDDALAVNENPKADDKETLFKNRINYVEKTPREYAFMNQRTHDGSSAVAYTALSFLNNVRVLEKMKKELERLGRNYLFEFNDAITLSQLSDVLNKYVMNWISNRTLATGVVTVERNPYSDEAVDINLTIRFNGTIEVISVQITIE